MRQTFAPSGSGWRKTVLALGVVGFAVLVASGCGHSVLAPERASSVHGRVNSGFQHAVAAGADTDSTTTDGPYIWDQD